MRIGWQLGCSAYSVKVSSGLQHVPFFNSFFRSSAISSGLLNCDTFHIMRTLQLVILFFLFENFAKAGLQAGTITPSNTVPAIATYVVGERKADSKSWLRIQSITNEIGEVTTTTNQGYQELAAGLCHLVNGVYVDSDETISILADGSAAATNGQHQAYFPANIAAGVIELVTSDGQRLHSRPLGLSYYDGSNSVLIAELKNSEGHLLGTGNQVIYTNAFTDIEADLLCTYRKSGFECDVILRSRPPSPTAFASSGLNPQVTRLQLMTEFLDTPEPQTTVIGPSPRDGLQDAKLKFGAMTMGHGKAFILGAVAPQHANQYPVYKTWAHLDGRTVLVEELPWLKIAGQLQGLPISLASERSADPIIRKVVSGRAIPAHKNFAAIDHSRIAKADIDQKPGFVVDYVAVSTMSDDFTFRGDTTYYISDYITLSGLTTIIEGGTVIKYARGAALFVDSVTCQTAPYRPAIFTAKDDNSVGETISGSSGLPSGLYADSALTLAQDITLEYMRFSYAYIGVTFSAQDFDCTDVARHIQAVHCYGGISPLSGSGSCYLSVQNCLFYDDAVAIYGQCSPPITGEFLTVANCNAFDTDDVDCSDVLFVTNSVFANLDQLGINNSPTIDGDNNGFYNCPTFGSTCHSNTVNPFQRGAYGYFYLATNSGYQNLATTNIDQGLLSDLQKMTTCPPLVYSNSYPPPAYSAATLTNDLTLSPTAQRDKDLPDLGYHYTPLDYVFSSVLLSNAQLTITPGTAIASYGTAGIFFTGGSFVSVGTPLQPIWLVEHKTVQEGDSGYCLRFLYEWNSQEPNMAGIFRFNNFANLAGHGWFSGQTTTTNMLVQDCQFWSGELDIYSYTLLRNNLFDRTYLYAFSSPVVLSNNLFWGDGMVYLIPPSGLYYQAYDNVFDNCVINASSVTNAYNGFINCMNPFGSPTQLLPTNSTSVILSSFSYDKGNLGDFYQHSTNFLNRGSTTANLDGLYHYTTQTNNFKETNSTVDIGYHYVAVSPSGNAIDTDGDGLADYFEEGNGNGIFDSTDFSDWTMWDTDGDGVSDYREFLDATDPRSADSQRGLLGRWHFDTTNWLGVQGQIPTVYTNVCLAEGVLSNAMEITNIGGTLCYKIVETGGATNLNLQSGTLRFWFRPNWNSSNLGGTGPGSVIVDDDILFDFGALVEVTAAQGFWGLYFDDSGNKMFFDSSDGTNWSDEFGVPIAWVSNNWHQVVFEYSATNRTLYIDGILASQTNGVTALPYFDDFANENVFTIGNDGSDPVRGSIDELDTFNYQLPIDQIIAKDSDGNHLFDLWQMRYFGHLGVDPSADPDGDGFNNLKELNLETNPADPNDPLGFRILISRPIASSSIP
jgi:hypothetical protein